MKIYLTQVTGSKIIMGQNNVQAFAGFYLANNEDEARGHSVAEFEQKCPTFSMDAVSVTDYTENVLWAATKLLSELKI